MAKSVISIKSIATPLTTPTRETKDKYQRTANVMYTNEYCSITVSSLTSNDTLDIRLMRL